MRRRLRADDSGVTEVREALRRPPALVLAAAAVLAVVWLAVDGGPDGALVLLVTNALAAGALVVGIRNWFTARFRLGAGGVSRVVEEAPVPLQRTRRMPGMDGYDATALIRASEGPGRRTPIVAMTASAMLADRQRCLEVGMDNYLSKPVRLAEVADKVEQWLPGGPALTSPATAGVPGAETPATVPPDAAAPGQGPVLDEEIVAGLRDLGPDFLARLVPVFVLAAPDRLAALRAAVDAGDPGALADAAHSLRGSAGNLGGFRVADLCSVIENGPGQDARARLEQVEVELDRMLDAVLALVRVTA